MNRTPRQWHRRLLLWTSLAYGILAVAVPGALVAHTHLAAGLATAAGITAALLVTAVMQRRELGGRRAQLAWRVLLAGPLGPVLLARRTSRWQPVLLVRPRPAAQR